MGRPSPYDIRLSCQQCFRKPVPMLKGYRAFKYAGLRGLGDAPANRSDFDIAGNMLRQQNAQIKSLEQSLITANQNGDQSYVRQMGPQVIEARNRYEALKTAYIYAYGTSFGPPDTTGLDLGQWQVYVVSGVGIAVIIAGIYELNKYLNNVAQQAQALQSQAQANQAQQSNIAFAQQQLAQAQASGDEAAVAQWSAVIQANASYQTPGAQGSQSFMDFVKANAGWIAAGVAAVFVLPRVIE